jgi:hypothetical protein
MKRVGGANARTNTAVDAFLLIPVYVLLYWLCVNI